MYVVLIIGRAKLNLTRESMTTHINELMPYNPNPKRTNGVVNPRDITATKLDQSEAIFPTCRTPNLIDNCPTLPKATHNKIIKIFFNWYPPDFPANS
jgi:hypothetical protein